MSSVKMEICMWYIIEERGGDEPPPVEPDRIYKIAYAFSSMTEKIGTDKTQGN